VLSPANYLYLPWNIPLSNSLKIDDLDARLIRKSCGRLPHDWMAFY
jgi:hypothetical protein